MKNNTKKILQWLITPIIITYLLYSFMTLEFNPCQWVLGFRIMSVITLFALYWVSAKFVKVEKNDK